MLAGVKPLEIRGDQFFEWRTNELQLLAKCLAATNGTRSVGCEGA